MLGSVSFEFEATERESGAVRPSASVRPRVCHTRLRQFRTLWAFAFRRAEGRERAFAADRRRSRREASNQRRKGEGREAGLIEANFFLPPPPSSPLLLSSSLRRFVRVASSVPIAHCPLTTALRCALFLPRLAFGRHDRGNIFTDCAKGAPLPKLRVLADSHSD